MVNLPGAPLNSVEHPAADPARSRAPNAFLTGICFLLLGALPPLAVAQESAAAPNVGSFTIERVEIGLEGHYKVAEWTAVRVRVRATTSQSMSLVIEAPDSDGNLAEIPGPSIDVPAAETRTFETCFRTGRLQGDLVIRLVDGKGNVLWQRRSKTSAAQGAEFRPALLHGVPLIVSLAELPELRTVESKTQAPPPPFSSLGDNTGFDPHVVRLAGFDDLPASVRALESIAAIVIPTARRPDGTSPLTGLTPARSAQLRDWVLGGGHLLVTVAAEESAYRASPLAAWVPAKVEGAAALRQILDLERYSDVNAPLRFSGAIKTARLGGLPARNVLVKEGNNPLVAVVPFGFGRVTVVALDLESPPLSTWPALPAVLRKLMGGPTGAARKQSQQSNRQLTQTGITDLATQLQLALEDFPAVQRPSHWWVMGLLIAYLLVIGPLDYLVVNRWLKRPELTWFTFGAMVCLGAGAAAWGATRINGESVLFNQLDLIDFDAATRSIRGRSWASFYSPENRRYAIAVDPLSQAIERRETADAGEPQSTLTWSGVPENSVSGVYRSGGAGIGGQQYRFDVDSHAVENLPILQWSTKSLLASWNGETSGDLVESHLESAGAGQLTGTITHHLPEPLEECLFVVGGWAYFPAGDKALIAPNVPWQPGGPQAKARDLKALLTGERRTRVETTEKFRSDVLTTTVPYNSLNQNRGDLIHMLSFYQVVGGAEYTGLNHAALRDLELTHLMALGRGILIGRIKSPASRAKVDGQSLAPSEAQAFVRLIVPVQHSERAPVMKMPKFRDPLPSSPSK